MEQDQDVRGKSERRLTVRDTYERLRYIQDAIASITKYTTQGRDSFDKNELVQTWVIHHLKIIGEAAHAIPQDFKTSRPEIQWSRAISMQHMLLYHYFEINLDRVWAAVEYDWPSLKASVDAILAGQEGT